MYRQVTPISEIDNKLSAFYGLNYNEELKEGEFADTLNMTDAAFPCIRPRDALLVSNALGDVCQGAFCKRMLATVIDKYLYYGGDYVHPINSVAFTSGEKQLISMGAYIIVFPDWYYYNTEKPSDKGYIERYFATGTGVSTTFTLCKQDGTAYATPTVSATAPDNPADQALWIDSSATPHTLMQWSDSAAMWVEIPTVYVKIASTGIGAGIKMYDSVEISGITASGSPIQSQLQFLNGTMIVYDCGNDYIVVAGIIDQTATITDTVHCDMTIPSMDYVCESNNRLWGCKYGIVNNEPINEIYACKLGDFRNWRNFMGLSTDSYTVSLGSDGEFTGCVNYLGYPIFFKEGCIHKIYGTTPANYQVQNTIARGVQKGSWRSLCIIDEKLYYKSTVDICVYDGSLPAKISDALGYNMLKNGVFGNIHGVLWMSFCDDNSQVNTYSYNPKSGVWHRHELPRFVFISDDNDGYSGFMSDDAKLYSFVPPEMDEEPDETVKWELKTGRISYGHRITSQNDALRLLKCEIRMRIEKYASVKVYAEYDDSGVFEKAKEFHCSKLNTYVLPVFIHKCDHVRLKIMGSGYTTIFSISRIYTEGANR